MVHMRPTNSENLSCIVNEFRERPLCGKRFSENGLRQDNEFRHQVLANSGTKFSRTFLDGQTFFLRTACVGKMNKAQGFGKYLSLGRRWQGISCVTQSFFREKSTCANKSGRLGLQRCGSCQRVCAAIREGSSFERMDGHVNVHKCAFMWQSVHGCTRAFVCLLSVFMRAWNQVTWIGFQDIAGAIRALILRTYSFRT